MSDKHSAEHVFIKSSSRHLFVAMVGIIVCCYVFDIVFFGNWAPRYDEFYLTAFWWIVFVTVGVGFRTMAIRIGIFLDHSRGRGTRSSGLVLRGIQIGCFFICTLATISFFAAEPERRAMKNDLAVAATDVIDTSIGDQKIVIGDEITRLEAARDAAIAVSQGTIDNILNDGEADDEEDQETVRLAGDQIAAVRKEYEGYIQTQNAALVALAVSSTGNTIEQKTVARSSSTWAIFDWQQKRTGLKAMDVTDVVMMIITLIIEITATWGVGGFARRMTQFRHNIAQRSIDDRLTEAQQAAELEAGELRAKLTVDDLMRKIRRDHEKDEIEGRDRDARHVLELEVQKIRSDARNRLTIREAEQEAAALLGEPDPYATKPSDPFFDGLTPKNDGSSRGGESGDITKKAGGHDKAIPVSDGRDMV